MLLNKITALFAIGLISLTEAYRALVFFPICSKSHHILANGIVNNLLEDGHEVVHVTCHPGESIANLTELDISFIEKRFNKDPERAEFVKLKNLVRQKNFADSVIFFYMTYIVNKEVLNEDLMINFLSDKDQKFDVVIAEWMFSEMVAGLGPLFQSPFIWFSTTEAHWQVLRLVDEISNPAYNVDIFSSNNPPLNFWERVSELATLVRKWLMLNCVILPLEMYTYSSLYQSIAAKRGISIPSYTEAVYNASLLLLNSHPSFGTPYKLPQNAKYIGGYHIDTDIQPLPKDLQKVMDESKHGVIYFSMGSNLKSADMSDHMRDSLLKMYSTFKQTVIWKFEDDLDNVPANIHLVKWVPQQSVLAHPNLKVFVTHGGQLSIIEAIHFGVPVIGLPVYGDQYINMKSAADKGFGIIVKLAENMAEDLQRALQESLNNASYSNRAKHLSVIYHDRLVSPGKELVHWVNHVVRTQGAPHLRSPAVDVPWYRKAYLDLLCITLVVLYMLYRIIKKVISLKKSDSNIIKKVKKN